MPTNSTDGTDRRAMQILFNKYWTPGGWRFPPAAVAPADFEYAKRAGVMFDPLSLSHRDLVARARAAVQATDRRRAADAFVSSLSSRQRLDLRSALGSYAVLQHLPVHDLIVEYGECAICRESYRSDEPLAIELDVLNFERWKWGGVRHYKPSYCMFDLEQFARLRAPVPAPEDVERLKTLLNAIEAAPAGTTAAALQKHLGAAFDSDKQEREIVIQILGYCGILGTAEHPGFLRAYASARPTPPRTRDMSYPACWWRREDGVSQEAVAYWFAHLL